MPASPRRTTTELAPPRTTLISRSSASHSRRRPNRGSIESLLAMAPFQEGNRTTSHQPSTRSVCGLDAAEQPTRDVIVVLVRRGRVGRVRVYVTDGGRPSTG